MRARHTRKSKNCFVGEICVSCKVGKIMQYFCFCDTICFDVIRKICDGEMDNIDAYSTQ